MTPFIQTLGLEYAYSLEGGVRVEALRGVDLSIKPGEFVALVGANGSGKSTLARHFNGLLLPTSGQVWVDGLSTSAWFSKTLTISSWPAPWRRT